MHLNLRHAMHQKFDIERVNINNRDLTSHWNCFIILLFRSYKNARIEIENRSDSKILTQKCARFETKEFFPREQSKYFTSNSETRRSFYRNVTLASFRYTRKGKIEKEVDTEGQREKMIKRGEKWFSERRAEKWGRTLGESGRFRYR